MCSVHPRFSGNNFVVAGIVVREILCVVVVVVDDILRLAENNLPVDIDPVKISVKISVKKIEEMKHPDTEMASVTYLDVPHSVLQHVRNESGFRTCFHSCIWMTTVFKTSRYKSAFVFYFFHVRFSTNENRGARLSTVGDPFFSIVEIKE